jgi:hypothetical protein
MPIDGDVIKDIDGNYIVSLMLSAGWSEMVFLV